MVRLFPNERIGLVTINGKRGCFTRSTSSYFISDLPDPKPYDGPHFNVLDYASPKYAEAKTIEEAIEMRGADAFFDQVSAEDFSQDSQEVGTLLGFAELCPLVR